MKNKVIFVVIGVLLVIVVVFLIYFLGNRKVTLTDKELDSYLEYIPCNYIDEDAKLIFSRSKTTINDVNNEALVGNALRLNIEDETTKATKQVINKLVLKMYNKDVSKANLADFITDGIYSYELVNDEYEIYDFTNFPIFIYIMEKYEANNKELVIYTRIAQIDYRLPDDNITLLLPTFGEEITSFDTSDVNVARDYMKNNKDEFPLFKNTYKKVNDGYVWIKTEKIN